jgi:hypothetical protein
LLRGLVAACGGCSSRLFAGRHAALTLHRKPVVLMVIDSDTEFIEAAIQPLRSTQTEFIMSKQITLIQATVAALLLAVGTAHAASQEIVKLPRVVIVGKATPDVQVAKIEQLPRVVVTGLSLQTQMQRQLLASATPATTAPVAVKFTARAL